MIRKCTTLFLALLLAVMLPLGALADVQHTLTLIPGDELASEPVVKDVMDALTIRLTTGEKSGALTVRLGDYDVATVGFAADPEGLYAHTALVSDDVLFINWDEGLAYLGALLKMGVTVDNMSAAEVAEMVDAMMGEMKNAIMLAMQGEQPETAIKSPEELMAMVEEMFKDDPAMVEYIKSVYSDMVIEKGSFPSDKHDAATEKYTMTMDNEDLLTICDTNYMRNILQQGLQMENPELTGEELAKQVDALLEEVRETYRNSDLQFTMTIHTLNEGTEIVNLDMNMDMTVVEGETSETANMVIGYNRLTAEGEICHKGGLTMTIDGEQAIEMVLDIDKAADGAADGFFTALADGEQITVQYKAADNASVKESSYVLYARSGAAAIIEPSAADRPLITLCIATEELENSVVDVLDSAAPATSVDVMKLTGEDWEALGNEAMSRVQRAALLAMGHLPDSLLTMIMQEQMGE